MNTTLFWFSGTGNTLALVRQLSTALGNAECRPIIAELNRQGPISVSGRIGVCFPLYFLSFPKPVVDFLDRLEATSGTELFAVVSRGLSPMGGVLGPLTRVLKKKNIAYRGLYYVTMPNNDITLFKPDAEAEIVRKMGRLPQESRRIAKALNRPCVRSDCEPLGWVRPFRHKPAYMSKLSRFGGLFHVTEGCTGCGICSRVCPMDNISLIDGKPVWGNDCVLCEACLNWCPVSASQFDTATEGKDRYRCEHISIRDIAGQKGSS